jgi:hypothetical protein
MLTINLALVSEIEDHDPSDLARVAAALQRQAARDFAPVWDVSATVDGFPRLEDVPVGYRPMIIVPDVQGAAGIHLDKDGQPFALIEMSDSWSLTASHEMLDARRPVRNRLVPGPSIKRWQGRVEYLVEVCDPSEAAEFAYTVNDILVFDFYTPRFSTRCARWPRATASPARSSVRGRCCGAATSPGTIRRPTAGGSRCGSARASSTVISGVFDAAKHGSLRAFIDPKTDHRGIDKGLPKSDASLRAAVRAGKETAEAGASKAAAWRDQDNAAIEASRR